MHESIASRQVTRFRKWTPLRTRLGLSLTAVAALLLAACSGAGPASAGAGTEPPEQVSGLNHTGGSEHSIEVSWEAPASDEKISGYELRWHTGTGDWTAVRDIGPDTMSYTISGLSMATEYEVQVRAVSDAGAGPWSAPLAVKISDTSADPPTGPTLELSGTPGASSVTIEWTEPPTELTISGYLVQWRLAADPNWDNAESYETAGDATTYTVANLTASTDYLIRVSAVTEPIDGEWSTDLEVTTAASDGGGGGTGGTGASTRIAAPTGVNATVESDTSIAVGWNPVTPPEGVTLTGYQVSSGSGSPISAAATATSHTLTGLMPGTSYTPQVRAVAGSEYGAWGSAPAVSTTGGVACPTGVATPNVQLASPAQADESQKNFFFTIVVRETEPPQQDVDIVLQITSSGVMGLPASQDRTVTLTACTNSVSTRITWEEDGDTNDGSVTGTIQSNSNITITPGQASKTVSIVDDS